MYYKEKHCKKCGSHFLQEFWYAHLCLVCGFFKDKPTRAHEVFNPATGRNEYIRIPVEGEY